MVSRGGYLLDPILTLRNSHDQVVAMADSTFGGDPVLQIKLPADGRNIPSKSAIPRYAVANASREATAAWKFPIAPGSARSFRQSSNVAQPSKFVLWDLLSERLITFAWNPAPRTGRAGKRRVCKPPVGRATRSKCSYRIARN